jgi:hypothetical protein
MAITFSTGMMMAGTNVVTRRFQDAYDLAQASCIPLYFFKYVLDFLRVE